MIRWQHVNPQGTRVYFGTLTDGADIHAAISEFAQRLNISTATFEMLGGLSYAEFTEFDFATGTRRPPLCFERPLEIIGGHGTLSQLDDAPHTHLHLVLAFQDADAPNGISVIGGHVARANAFAVEFTLQAYEGAIVRRGWDEGAKLRLWDL